MPAVRRAAVETHSPPLGGPSVRPPGRTIIGPSGPIIQTCNGSPVVVDVAGVAGRVEGLIRTHYKERHNEHV